MSVNVTYGYILNVYGAKQRYSWGGYLLIKETHFKELYTSCIGLAFFIDPLLLFKGKRF